MQKVFSIKDKQRFWIKVNKTNYCWEWTAALDTKGYGVFGIGYKLERVHRVSYLLKYGVIPDNLCVLHKCDNPKCVRPGHLFLGTQKDNALDREKKGRHTSAKGENIVASKLTAKQIKEIRKVSKYLSNRTIAKIYCVSHTCINDVVNGKYWRHI